MMTTSLDVANFILERRGPMSGKKLQKLVYYAQCWSLVWTNEPLFDDRIEAWRDGPVTPRLFSQHRYEASVSTINGGRSNMLTATQMDVIESVLGFYGDRTASELVALSHSEDPWIHARHGLLPWQNGSQEITHDAMRSFYSKEAILGS